MSKLFPYRWYLKNNYPANHITQHNCSVFGTFVCGGGSTMGYKLAGYNHLGGVEIDPKIADVYKTNHNPKHLFIEDIRNFNKRDKLPNDLFDIDLLDGSPPCSSFSMSGNREKDWGKSKKFKEGQALQRLDDLFFDYIRLAERIKPKVILAENVKGLIQGNAKSYVKKIKLEFEKIGYNVQLFLLNAASMGVPQKRERVFFICRRKDLKLPKLKLSFNEKSILFIDIEDNKDNENIIDSLKPYYDLVKPGENFSSVHPKGHYFNSNKANPFDVLPTITADDKGSLHYSIKRKLNKKEICLAGSYPLDYNFKNVKPKWLIGMSVPPVMIAQIAHQIYLQWLTKIN